MVWQYLQIIIQVLWRYISRRFVYVRSGTWLMHRYQTGHLLLGETILLCEEKRKSLVLLERKKAEQKEKKKLKAVKVYAVEIQDKPLESDLPQLEE